MDGIAVPTGKLMRHSCGYPFRVRVITSLNDYVVIEYRHACVHHCLTIIVRAVLNGSNCGGRCLLLLIGLEVKRVNEMSVDGSGVANLEGLIEQINAALEQGDWAQVVALTAPLHECASAMGETQLADLVQDLHWIANDALVNPLFVTSLMSEVLP